MFALFLALTFALGLLLWAELAPAGLKPLRKARTADAPAPVAPLEALVGERPASQPTTAAPDAPTAEDEALMARLATLLATPEPAPEAPQEALPSIAGYRPGDVIELELDGPAPRAEDIAFEQVGHDARVVIEGFPALVLQQVRAATLTPGIFRFRSPQLA